MSGLYYIVQYYMLYILHHYYCTISLFSLINKNKKGILGLTIKHYLLLLVLMHMILVTNHIYWWGSAVGLDLCWVDRCH